MKKMGKRFMALLVVFTSIMSFLPAGFGGLVAKAADFTTDAATVRVNIDGDTTSLPSRTDTSTSTRELIYTTKDIEDKFDITVKDVTKTEGEWVQYAKDNNTSVTGIIGQDVIILSINGTIISDSDGNKNTAGEAIISGMGITITKDPRPDGVNLARIGSVISGLPAGVNKIQYAVKVTTEQINYTPANVTTNTAENAVADTTTLKTKTATIEDITIEHGSDYAISKIQEMTFKAYVGEASAFSADDTVTTSAAVNNTVPFLYSTTAKPDPNMQLRYNFDVPDALTSLKYIMNFGSIMGSLVGATVYKNGALAKEGTDYNISGSQLTGDLTDLSKSDLIVIRINSSTDSTTSTKKIAKAYAIEIRYNRLSADKDFSLKEAGITKLNYDNDSSVLAYVGKKYTVTNDNGFPTYNGDITIDKKATMISLDPTLIRPKSTLAYVVTNNYVDDTGTTQVKQSVLKNGKQFIDFMAGATSNILQLDVYEGVNGSKTGSTPLARYYFKVNPLTGNDFNMGLKFTSPGSTYLTQPGVKGNIIGAFTTDRRTYDLYTPDPVTVALTGARSTNNEYIRVWLGDDVNSDNLTEATASSNNALNYSDPTAQDYLERSTSLDITFGKAKKIVVQAYYDKFQYDSTGKLKTNSDGAPVYNSYSVGDKYVFYIPDNYDKTTPITGDKSTNATLNSLKLSGYTLKDSDGNSGFSSEKFDYTSTVAKEDTTAKITAVAEDDNVQSIVATINGQDGAYNLASGEASELPLNTNGTTNIKIVVTAQDGTTSKTYTVLVTNNSKSSNVNLKNVILNVGDYTFDPTADTTKVRVDQNVTNITVTPITADSKATVTVNGEEYSASAINVNLKGAQKTEINIEVKSEDGTTSKTYTLEVYRVDAADWTDNTSSNANDPTQDDQYYDEYNSCWVDTTKYEEWGSVNGKPAYFDKKNRQVKEAWITTGGKLYYLNNLGYRASGWKIDDVNGKTYYLDPITGEIKKGWMNLNNSWYYLNLNGVMQKGWLSLNKKWYYFNPNGQMVTNQSMFIDDKTYNFAQDGSMY